MPLLLVLLACSDPSEAPTPPVPEPADDSDAPVHTGGPHGLPWSDDPCATVVAVQDPTGQLGVWESEGRPSGGLVLAGSSSIRRWEHARRDLSSWGAVQRGWGGAWLSDLAVHAERWAADLEPEGVLVYAGTNDLAGGATPDQVETSYRCFVERVFDAMGPVPIVFVGVTPSPARWDGWSRAEALNARIAALTARHPDLHYADVAAPFLAQGQPPPASLFVADGLHLSASGYALWTDAVLPALTPVPTRPTPVAIAPSGPFYVRVDLGPSNPEDGARAPTIDGLGIHWNAWHPVDGDAQVLAGEVLRSLTTTTGEPTGIDLVVAGGFRVNGYANGGLTTPDGTLLGTLALAEATGDFFYTGDPDDPGALAFTGLDPARAYTLRLFASRADPEVRVTRYTVAGAGPERSVDLTTSGPGSGLAGTANDDEVAVLTGLQPDAWGELHLDVAIQQGAYAYLSLVELQGE